MPTQTAQTPRVSETEVQSLRGLLAAHSEAFRHAVQIRAIHAE